MAQPVVVEMRLEIILYMSCSLLAAALLVLILLITSEKAKSEREDEMVRARKREVVYVAESPVPTMNMSSPRPSPFLTHRKMRRAGKRRVSMHRRHLTLTFNPKLQNHCGYECILKAASKTPTRAHVRDLRQRVADQVWKRRVEDVPVLGMSMHDIIAREQMSLDAYYHATCRDMWASQAELEIAAELEGIAVDFVSGASRIKLGQGTVKYAIKKVGEHFVLVKKHKRRAYTDNVETLRAGMQGPWSWEDPRPMRDAEPTPEYTTVRTSPHFRHEIRRITFVRAALTIADLKARLSAIFKIPVAAMNIHDDDDDSILPDWTNPTSSVQMTVNSPMDVVRLDVRVPDRGSAFEVQVSAEITPDQLEQRLCAILGTQPRETMITTMRGTPWLTAMGMQNHVVVVRFVERGGMRNEISPTLEFIPVSNAARDGDDENEEEESDEVINMRMRDMVEGAHDGRPTPEETPRRIPAGSRSRSRSGSRATSPGASLGRMSASPTRHGYHSRAYPSTLPSAQSDPISRLVTEEEEIPVGYIWADPDAAVMEVIQTLRLDLHIYPDITVIPETASVWRNVQRLDFARRPTVPVHRYKDMCIDRWEIFQKPRPVPILYKGIVESYMVFPWSLSLSTIQYRVELWASSRHMYTAQAIDLDTYVIVKRDLPERIVTTLDAMRDYVNRWIQRAGVRIRYAYAHDCDRVKRYDAYQEEVVAEFICHLSEQLGLSTDDIVVTAAEWLPKLEDRLGIYSCNILYVILVCYLEHDDYKDLWPWYPRDILNMAVQQRGIPKVRDKNLEGEQREGVEQGHDHSEHYCHDELYPIPEGEPVVFSPICRAGMQNMRPQQQKAQMISWAEQKVRTESPEAQGKTLSMILRAEPRTITAIMHAKSPSQTKEVIIAAYKRAGLPSPFHPPPEAQVGNQEIVRTLTEQTKITEDIAKVLSDMPRGKHYEELVALMRDSQASYIHAVEALANSVSRLEATMSTWEEPVLPHMLGHALPRPPPITTPIAMDAEVETVVGTQDYMTPERRTPAMSSHEHAQPVSMTPEDTRGARGHEDLDQPPGFERIQSRSLRSCCERVVQPDHGTTEPPVRTALRPFGGRA